MKPLKGENIRLARQTRGMTRRELAEQLEVHWSLIVDLETNAKRIGQGNARDVILSPEDDGFVFQLCRLLRFPVAFFQREFEPMPVGSLAYHGEWTDAEIEAF